MSNMSYCRFENTARDLSDCQDHLTDNLSGTEAKARRELIDTCVSIVENLGLKVITQEDFEGLTEIDETIDKMLEPLEGDDD